MPPTYPTRRTGLGRGLEEIVALFDLTLPDGEASPLIGGPEVIPLEAVPVAMLLADWSGRVRAVNNRWVELSGLNAEESMGAGWLQALDRLDRPALEAALARADCGPAVIGGEYRWAGREGRAAWHVAAQTRGGERIVGIAVTDVAVASRPHQPTPAPRPCFTELPDPLRTELPDPFRPELLSLLRSVEALLVTLDRLVARLPELELLPA